MPFVSQNQEKWAFANDMPFARRWARETGPYKKLPKRVRKKRKDMGYAHGPGGLLSASGLGGKPKRKRRTYTVKDLEAYVATPGYSEDTAQQIAAQCAELPRLKGEQIAPGITRIRGNLCNVHGRYGACPGAPTKPLPVPAKGKRGRGRGRRPIKTEAQRQAEREAKRQQREQEREAARLEQDAAKRRTRDKLLSEAGLDDQTRDALVDARAGDVLAPVNGTKLAGMGLAEQAKDGSYRLTAAGRGAVGAALRGDAGSLRDILSKAGEAKPEKPAKPAKGGGGGGKGGAVKPSPEERKRQQQQDRAAMADKTAAQVGLSTDDVASLRRAAEQGDVDDPALERLGLIGSDGRTTDQGRRALSALERGDVRGYQAAIQDAQARLGRESAAQQRQQETAQRRQQREQERARREAETAQRRQAAAAERVRRAQERAERQRARDEATANRPLRRKPIRGEKAMAAIKSVWSTGSVNDLPDSAFLFVESGGKKDESGKTVPRSLRHFPYKNASGGIDLPHLRNAIARIPQSNAKGLNKAAVQKRAQALLEKANKGQKSFTVFKQSNGRYRWVAFSSNAYQDRDKEIVSTKALEDDCARADADGNYGPLRWWHVPNVELGTCDFNAMHGRILVESGTFKSERVGEVVAQNADNLRMSIGFNHPPDEPDKQGIFHTIKRFERSLVPRARASNPWTALQVTKEQDMFDDVKRAALKALGFKDEEIDGLSAQATATQKDAEESGATYKDAPEWAQALISRIEALEAGTTEKASPPPPPAEEPPAEDEATLMADGVPEEPMMEEEGGLTLSAEDLSAIGQAVGAALQAALGPLVGAMDMTNKMGAAMSDLKAMMGTYQGQQTQKDDARSKEIAALQATLKDTQSKLAELMGETPPAYKTAAHRITDNPVVTAERKKELGTPEQAAVEQAEQFPFGPIIAKLNQNGAGI